MPYRFFKNTLKNFISSPHGTSISAFIGSTALLVVGHPVNPILLHHALVVLVRPDLDLPFLALFLRVHVVLVVGDVDGHADDPVLQRD